MSSAFHRMHLDRSGILSSGDVEPAGVSLMRPLVTTAHRYRDLAATTDDLLAVGVDVAATLESLLALLADPVLAEPVERALAAAQQAPEVVGTESFDGWVAAIEELDECLSAADLGHHVEAIQVERDRAALVTRIEQDVPPEALLAGHLEQILGYLLAFHRRTATLEDLAASICRIREDIANVRSSYEGAYLSEDEWNVGVALADRLLVEGLDEWLAGLDDLERACLGGNLPAIRTAVEALAGANLKLVQVERLARS